MQKKYAGLKKTNHTTALQIDNLERLLAKIENDFNKVISMILDMQNTYTGYLDQANKANKERNEICTYALALKQRLHISNKERAQAVSFLQQQIIKVKRYKKMIGALQSLVLAKPDKPLLFIKKLID